LVDEIFYGQALREAESGVRRDDIWAKALATSDGELDRIRSIYIELLAQYLASANAKERRTKYWSEVKRRVKKFLIFFAAVLTLYTIAAIGCNALYKNYKNQWLVQHGDKLQARDRHEPRRLFDRDGKAYLEPTTKELWDIELAARGLISPNNFSQLQVDMYQMSGSQLYGRYGESASTLILARSSISGDMFSARPPSMWDAILSGFKVR
jgi:hypothetical protein